MSPTAFWLAVCALHAPEPAPTNVTPPFSAAADSSSDSSSDARSDESPGEAQAEAPAAAPPALEASLGAHFLWASGKALPGVSLHAGRRFVWLDFETSLIALTERAPSEDLEFLGSQLGLYVMLRPLYGERGELATGLGSDVYALWNIHGDEWQAAFALRVAGHVWLSRRLGLFATARAYPVATSGLELGSGRDGSRGLPVLFGTGIEWRL